MTFSVTAIAVLIYGALGLCTITVLLLLGFLIREWKEGKIW